MTPPGDSEKRVNAEGVELVSGECACCGQHIAEGESSIVRFHPTQPGGLFLLAHAPTGGDWYGLEDGE